MWTTEYTTNAVGLVKLSDDNWHQVFTSWHHTLTQINPQRCIHCILHTESVFGKLYTKAKPDIFLVCLFKEVVQFLLFKRGVM